MPNTRQFGTLARADHLLMDGNPSFNGSQNVNATESQAHVVPILRSYSRVLSAERARHEQMFVAEVAMSACRLALMRVKRDPCRKRRMACLACCGDVVPKDVNDVLATIKTSHAIQFVDGSLTPFCLTFDLRRDVLHGGRNVLRVLLLRECRIPCLSTWLLCVG